MSITCGPRMSEVMGMYRTLLYKVQTYAGDKLAGTGLYPQLTSFCISAIGESRLG